MLALLPELATAAALPPSLLVAHPAREPSRLLGAAALVPQLRDPQSPGFPGLWRVLPAYRRGGIGRALLSALAVQARRWDIDHLHAWEPLAEGSEAAFLRALGFRPQLCLYDFVSEGNATPALTHRLLTRLRNKGRLPPTAQLLPLAEAPLARCALLYSLHFGCPVSAALATLNAALADADARAVSVALLEDGKLLGFLLAAPAADMMEVKFWICDPAWRHGWPALMLLDEFMRRLQAIGGQRARYACNEKTLATLNLARKSGAVAAGMRHAYVLDLARWP